MDLGAVRTHLALSPVPTPRSPDTTSGTAPRKDVSQQLTNNEIHLVRPFLFQPVESQIDEGHRRIAVTVGEMGNENKLHHQATRSRRQGQTHETDDPHRPATFG
jgi:NADPH-dependent glutamate synthase beta subunit-like oxidoreductase